MKKILILLFSFFLFSASASAQSIELFNWQPGNWVIINHEWYINYVVVRTACNPINGTCQIYYDIKNPDWSLVVTSPTPNYTSSSSNIPLSWFKVINYWDWLFLFLSKNTNSNYYMVSYNSNTNQFVFPPNSSGYQFNEWTILRDKYRLAKVNDVVYFGLTNYNDYDNFYFFDHINNSFSSIDTGWNLTAWYWFDFENKIWNYYDFHFFNWILWFKDNINTISFYWVSNTTWLMVYAWWFESDLAIDSRLYISDVAIDENWYIKAFISLLWENTYLVEIDLLTLEVNTWQVLENQFFLGKTPDNYIYSTLWDILPINIKSNKDYVYIGLTEYNNQEFIAYYDDSWLWDWYIYDDNNESLVIYTNDEFNQLYPDIGIPPVAGDCWFLDVLCYVNTFFSYIFDILFAPIYSIIDNIKEFIAKFSDFFTTEVRDFSFLPIANASIVNSSINNTSVEDTPNFVKWINDLWRWLAFLFLIVAWLSLFLLINRWKNESNS